MTLLPSIKKIPEFIAAKVVNFFALKPHLLYVMPQNMMHLGNTFFVLFAYDDINEQWVVIHVQIPSYIVIKKSWFADWLFKHRENWLLKLQVRGILYRTGIYVALPLHIRTTDNLNIFAVQIPNVPITQENISISVNNILAHLNTKSEKLEKLAKRNNIYYMNTHDYPQTIN